jgi:hypothetical protein
MKKATVYGWITRQKDRIMRKEKNATLRAAKLAALQQCDTWLFSLTWAQMRAPVQAKREAIHAEGFPLLTKARQDPTSLSEQETNRLQELEASAEVYTLFYNKITPTARQAEIEVKLRQHEQARRTPPPQRK